MEQADRTRARSLTAEYLAKGDATGWFERLYSEAAMGDAVVPWAYLQPNLNLLSWWQTNAFDTQGKRALKIDRGFGDDAEQLSFETTGFDVAESPIANATADFPKPGQLRRGAVHSAALSSSPEARFC